MRRHAGHIGQFARLRRILGHTGHRGGQLLRRRGDFAGAFHLLRHRIARRVGTVAQFRRDGPDRRRIVGNHPGDIPQGLAHGLKRADHARRTGIERESEIPLGNTVGGLQCLGRLAAESLPELPEQQDHQCRDHPHAPETDRAENPAHPGRIVIESGQRVAGEGRGHRGRIAGAGPVRPEQGLQTPQRCLHLVCIAALERRHEHGFHFRPVRLALRSLLAQQAGLHVIRQFAGRPVLIARLVLGAQAFEIIHPGGHLALRHASCLMRGELGFDQKQRRGQDVGHQILAQPHALGVTGDAIDTQLTQAAHRRHQYQHDEADGDDEALHRNLVEHILFLVASDTFVPAQTAQSTEG